jgi:hypothetical protein
MTMNKIKAEPHACNDMKRTSLERSSPSWRTTVVLVGSLASGVLASVPIEVAHAASAEVPCQHDSGERGLINTIHNATKGDVLSLAQGCIYTLTDHDNSDPNLGDNGLPVISQKLTIEGNGATITRAQSASKFRIFEIASGGDLTLINLTVDNGDADDGGDITLNKWRKGRGGGIYNLGILTVINSIFSHNISTLGGGGIGNGDPSDFNPNNPTSVASGNLTLSDTVLFDNSSSIGGAIANGLMSTMNLTGSTISRNTGVGGGVGNQGNAIMDKCTISGNISATNGGGILNGGRLFLTNNPVTGNSATAGDGGGIMNVAGAIATLTHSDVSGNSATSDGGGIANGGHMTLTQSNVTANNAGQNGGGIANKSGAATLALTHSDVSGNSATSDGGGIFNQTGNTVTLNQSTVAGNTPDNCSGVTGC